MYTNTNTNTNNLFSRQCGNIVYQIRRHVCSYVTMMFENTTGVYLGYCPLIGRPDS